MSACVHSMFVLRRELAMADPPSQKYLRLLEQWDCGFESHSRHGCLRAFILVVLGRGFAMAEPPSQEISSLTRTMGLWVRMPFKAWMSACVLSVFVLISGFATR
jgi:hypothetical protein